MIAWRLGARISSPQLYQKDVIGTPDTMRSVARWILERLASWDKESSRGKWSVGVWGVLECRVLNASLHYSTTPVAPVLLRRTLCRTSAASTPSSVSRKPKSASVRMPAQIGRAHV